MKSDSILYFGIILLFCGTIHADEFTTLDGEKYTNATIKRVEPDGLVISYAEGITKLKFRNLSADLKIKYGYDPQKEASYRIQTQHEALARQAEAIDRAQEAQKKASFDAAAVAQEEQMKQFKNNTYSIKIVETDARSYIGKSFYLKGVIELSSYYNFRYMHAQDTHHSFKIHDGDIRKNTWGMANAYLVKEKSEALRKKIIEAGGELEGIFKVTILPDRFDDSSSLNLELIDFYPLDPSPSS